MDQELNIGDELTPAQIRALEAESCHFVGLGVLESSRWRMKINRGDSGPAAAESLERIAAAVEAGTVRATVEGLNSSEVVLDLFGPTDYFSAIIQPGTKDE